MGESGLAPNTGMESTPLRVEQDRRNFDSWFPLDGFPDLWRRRGSCPIRWAAHQRNSTQTIGRVLYSAHTIIPPIVSIFIHEHTRA
jgi:hypothetical protein